MFDHLLRAVGKTPSFPANAPMFYPGHIKRSDGLPVDKTLDNIYRMYIADDYDHDADPNSLHGLFHRTASISDLEPRLYHHCTENPNSIATWLPPVIKAHAAADDPVLKIPATRIMRLDTELAQYLRLEFTDTNELSRTLLDHYLYTALNLNADSDYFLKTGVFSGKFQFANAHCTEPKEVGQYLHVINNFAMTVGGGESVDIAVRDYIGNDTAPTVYNGMPLRCEYRVFVDFGDNTAAADAEPFSYATLAHQFADPSTTSSYTPRILGTTQYWHKRVIRQHFAQCADPAVAGYSGAALADKETFYNYEDTLDHEFVTHLPAVEHGINQLLPALRDQGFRGQWSIDVMVEGDSLYLIDMALMCESALVDELDTIGEHRYVDTDTIHRFAQSKLFGCAPAPEFVSGTLVDGHNVRHQFHHGTAAECLRAGVVAGLVTDDGTQLPPLKQREL